MSKHEKYLEVCKQMNCFIGYEKGHVIVFTHTPNGLCEPNFIMKNDNTGKEVKLFIEDTDVYVVTDESNNDTEFVSDVRLFESAFDAFEEFNQCENCNGEGYTEYGPICSRPASYCCGGCYQKIECECSYYKPFG